MKKKNLIACLISLVMIFAMMPVRIFADAEPAEMTLYSDLNEISKRGNVYFTLEGEKVLPQAFEDAGIGYGDIVTVSFLDKTIDIPVVENFSEVPSGDLLIRLQEDKTEISINYEDFASVYIADKNVSDDGRITWTYKEGIEGPVAFHIVLKDKGGWSRESGLMGLSYTDDRYDYYPRLNDEEFANFRMITTTGIANGILYRTCSPVNPVHKRDKYADAALRKYGVKTIMNLADSKDNVEGYEGYSGSYYSTCRYIALNMGMSFTSDEFRTKLASGLRFFADNPGPYAVHCTEGKDRGGLISAILECFMGASYDEVKRDYMVTFYNYYDISPEDERYEKIANANIKRTLQKLFDTEDIEQADLSKEAEELFREIGLTDTEINKLRANLGVAQSEETVEKPKKTGINKLIPARKALKVKWKKTAGVSGYQIQYGLRKNFKGAKKITVSKAGASSKKIKKLKAGKRYYVRIRTYKKVNGKKYYSAWSHKKSARTK